MAQVQKIHQLKVQARKQSGIALIIALIITTLAVTVAATIVYRQQIHIRLSGNISHLEQAYLYADGMEGFASKILEDSYKDHPKYDSLKDDWAFEGIVFPILGGSMSGQLFDLQARINLNSLARPIPTKLTQKEKQQLTREGKEIPPDKPDIAGITRYRLQNLLENVDPDAEMGAWVDFASIVKDWVDKDSSNGNVKPDGSGNGNGAESPYYQGLQPAYLSANTLLAHPTEIRLLKNMKKKFYDKLINSDPKKSLVSTLPISEGKQPTATPININTANKTVLQSIGFPPDSIEQIIEERKEKPFEALTGNTVLDTAFASLSTDPKLVKELKTDLAVKSDYFLLRGKVEINDARLFINSILYRKNGKVSVIMRDFSNP